MTNIGSGSNASDENMGIWNSPSSKDSTVQSAHSTTRPQTTFGDTIGLMGGKNAPDYVYGAGNPQIPQPLPGTANYNLGNMHKDAAKQMQAKLTQPTQNQAVMDNIDEAISNLFKQDPGQLASKFGGMTQEQIEDKLKYAYFHPDDSPPSDPIQQLAKKLTTKLQEAQNSSPNVPPSVQSEESLEEQIENAYSNYFTKLIDNNKAPLKDKQAAEYAFYNPEAQSNLTSSQTSLLNLLTAQVKAKISQKYGAAAANVTLKNSALAYNAKLNFDYENTYSEGLYALEGKGIITEGDLKALRTRMYYPDSIPISDALKSIESALQQKTTSSVITQDGLPENWQATVSTLPFDLWANGIYRDSFAAGVQKHIPSLSPETQQQLLAAMGDPSKVPNELQSLFDGIHNAAIVQASTALGLPAGWTPDPNIKPNVPDAIGAQYIASIKSYISDFQTVYDKLTAKVNEPGLSAGKKATLMSYLAVVGQALHELQQGLYNIELSNSKLADVLNKINLNLQLDKIAKAKAEAEKQREKAEKSEGKPVLALLGKILGPILVVLVIAIAVVISCIFLSVELLLVIIPLILAVGGVLLGASIATSAGCDVVSKIFEALDSIIAAIIPKGGFRTALQILIKVILIALVVTLLCLLGPGGLVLAMSFGMELIMKSNIIAQAVEVCGGDEEAQMIATIVVMVVLIVAMIVVMIVVAWYMAPAQAGNAATATSAGTQTAATAANVSAETTATGTQVAATGTQAATVSTEAVATGTQATATSTQATATGTQAAATSTQATAGSAETATGGAQAVTGGTRATTAAKETANVGKTAGVGEVASTGTGTTGQTVTTTATRTIDAASQVSQVESAATTFQRITNSLKRMAEFAQKALQRTATVSDEIAERGAQQSAQVSEQALQQTSSGTKVTNAAPQATQGVTVEGTVSQTVQGASKSAQSLQTVGSEGLSESTKLLEKTASIGRSVLNYFKGDTTTNLERLAALMQTAQSVVEDVYKIAKSAADIQLNLDLAKLVVQIAELKAEQAEIQGIIDQISGLIRSLMTELKSVAELVDSINTLQRKKYKDAEINFVTFA